MKIRKTKEMFLEVDKKYLVHPNGDVYNRKFNKKLKPSVERGYHRYGLWVNGKQVFWFEHHLVAFKYLPKKPKGKDEINHIDGVKGNNHYDNLEWCTHRENINHAVKDLGRKIGSDHNLKPIRNEAIVELKKLGWSNKKIGTAFGITDVRVTQILK